MDINQILSMDIIKRIDLYQTLNPEESLRWHILFDCTCGIPNCYYGQSVEHSENCPMHNPNNPNYDYL